MEQQLLFDPCWVVLQATDGFVAERDALAGQLLIVGQQIALTINSPTDEAPVKPRKTTK